MPMVRVCAAYDSVEAEIYDSLAGVSSFMARRAADSMLFGSRKPVFSGFYA